MSEAGRSRIWTVLIVLAIFMLLGMIGLWIIQGGFHSVTATVSRLGNPVDIIFHESTTTYSTRLPWQPSETTRGPDISPLVEEADRIAQQSPDEAAANEAAQQQGGVMYAGVKPSVSLSPYRDGVTLETGDASAASAAQQYIRIVSSSADTVDLNGWSLQSAHTGARAYLPGAVATFLMGRVNSPAVISLHPGESMIVSTGVSPVGVSFRENICTGYLGQLQEFTPALAQNCPGTEELSSSDTSAYGQSCIDFVENMPRCYIASQTPASLSPACQYFVSSTFTYMGCMQRHRYEANFSLPVWRVYLGSNAPLWGAHDSIRLLDAQDRIVDSFTY